MNPRPSTRLLFAALGFVMACAGPLRAPVTGAEGVSGLVTVEPIEGGEQLVTLSLEALPFPSHRAPALRTYVVWFAEETPRRVGELVYAPEAREGRMHAEHEGGRFRILITAERSAEVATPSEYVVVDQWVGEG